MNKILTTLFCLSVVFSSFSQELSDKDTDEVIDDLFKKEMSMDELLDSFSKYQVLYLSANYNDKTYFSGRDIGLKQFNFIPKISYLHYSGISVTLSGIYYDKFDPKWDLTTTSLGYGKTVGTHNNYRCYTSYTKYFYNNGVSNSFENDITVGFGVKNNNKTLGTQISGAYLFGKDQAFQLASTTFALFKLVRTQNYRFDFRPQFSLIAGHQTVDLARTYIQNGRVVTDFTTNKVFSMINKQVNLPLQMSINSFDFELGFNINFPSPTGTEANLKNTNYFNFSAAYLFDL